MYVCVFPVYCTVRVLRWADPSSKEPYQMSTRFIDKAIPIKDREGPYKCETSRLPQFLDNRLTNGGKVVSITRRPSFTSRKIPGTHFC
jgi:hypothetical protein